jgi:hypothetical protein
LAKAILVLLLHNIFHLLKKEIMITGTGFLAVAAREIAAENALAQQARIEAQKWRADAQKTRASTERLKRKILKGQTKSIMHGWNRGASCELLIYILDLSPNQVIELVSVFEKVKTYCNSNTEVDMKELKKISGLTHTELKPLLALLQQKGAV